MTVETSGSKQTAQQMGTSFTYDFTLDVLLKDPTEEEALKSIKAKVKLADEEEPELDLVYGTDYTVVLNPDRKGGTVTVTDKRTSGDYITIYREYELSQEADYQDFNSMPAETLEQCFDKLTMIEQQQQEVIERCVKVDMTSDLNPSTFAHQVERIYDSIDNVDAVADIKDDVQTVADVTTDVTTVAGIASDVTSVASVSSDIPTVAADTENIDIAAANISDINTCAENITDIQNAEENAALSKQYAIGVPTEPVEGSAKYWAGQAATGQIQADCAENDNTKKSYIQNKDLQYFDNTTTSFETTSNKGQANGYCPLDADAKIDETYLPKIDSGMTKFAINNGNENLLINNSNELAFDVDNSNPLTYTNIMGETCTVTALSPIDVSGTSDGTYKVALPQSGNQPYLFDGNVFIQETQPYKDYNIIGNPTINNGVVSGFSTSNYLTFKNSFNPKAKNWKLTIPFTTGNDISTEQDFYSSGSYNLPTGLLLLVKNSGVYLYASSNGLSWDIISNQKAFDVVASTDYLFEMSFDGSQYVIKYSTDNGTTWTTGLTVTSSSLLNETDISYIGVRCGSGQPFLGSIDVANMEFRVQDNLWINPQEMYTAQLDNITNWQDFNDILLLDSSVTVGSGVISNLEQPTYNYNGIVVNQSSQTNREFVSKMSMPSDTRQNFTVGASGSQYISPADGHWTAIGNGAINGNCYIQLINLSNNDGWHTSTGGAGYGITSSVKVKKGDIVELTYVYTTFVSFYFIPTVGGDN